MDTTHISPDHELVRDDDAPEGDILEGLRSLLIIVAAPLLAVGAYVGVGFLDESEVASVTERLERDARDRKSMPPADSMALRSPLPCDATMNLSVGGVSLHEGCYRKESK